MELVVYCKNECRTVELKEGESIFSCLLRGGLIGTDTCGGRGACMKCGILLLEGELPVKPKDLRAFDEGQLRQGYRLACTARPEKRCVIRTAFLGGEDSDGRLKIVSHRPGVRQTPAAVRRQAPDAVPVSSSDAVPVSSPAAVPVPSPAAVLNGDASDFIAVDLGTTTLVMERVDGRTREPGGVYRAMNPQRIYGADVVSRIRASVEGQGEELRRLIAQELNKGYRELSAQELDKGRRELSEAPGGVPDGAPGRMIVSCNTTMAHLLMGYPCEGLGRAPFTPHSLDFSCPLQMPCRTVVLPGASAFVGGDILSGLYALSFMQREKHALFIDLGTNGEMAVGCRDGILATSTAAGPAFEGGFTASLPGSDMIRLSAGLLASGILDETGLLREPYFERGYPVAAKGGKKGLLTQQDIRDLQMAKAAVRAGIEILLSHAGIRGEQVEEVFLAGGFGYYLDVKRAARIGLIPPNLVGRTKAVGNTSLEGAVRFGMDEAAGREELLKLKERTGVINLAETPGFEEKYIEKLNFIP